MLLHVVLMVVTSCTIAIVIIVVVVVPIHVVQTFLIRPPADNQSLYHMKIQRQQYIASKFHHQFETTMERRKKSSIILFQKAHDDDDSSSMYNKVLSSAAAAASEHNNKRQPQQHQKRSSTKGPVRTATATATQSPIIKQKQQQQQQQRYNKKQQSINVGYDPLLSLNMNLDALACAQAPDRAQELYHRIYALYKDGYYSVPPDIVSFNSVLKAWQYHPEQALQFWETSAKLQHSTSINIVSYNTFLLALARSGLYEAAESLLLHMQAYNAPIRPDGISYNTVLLSYSVAMSTMDNERNATEIGHRAEALLQQMINTDDDSNNHHESNTILCQSHDKNHTDHRTTTKQPSPTTNVAMELPPVLDINYRPPKPNKFSYNTVIAIWAEHPNVFVGAQKAEYWLQTMLQQYGIHPDVYTYTTVMKALSRCRHPTIPSRVRKLLDQMRATDDAEDKPNVIAYTTAIAALCYNQQIDDANQLFNDMIQSSDAYPDTCTYTTLFNGFATCATEYSKRNDTASKCQYVLRSVNKLYQQMMESSNNVSPDDRTYTSILKAYAATRQYDIGTYARQVLVDMINSNIQPSTIHYNAALNCYAKSTSPYKVIHAAKLWKEMIDAGYESCTITYNTLLYAASTVHFYTSITRDTDIRQRSLQIGQYIFDTLHMDPYCEPTSSTYQFYFNMLYRLLPKQYHHGSTTLTTTTTELSLLKVQDRISLYKNSFTLCCNNGCFDPTILDRILKSINDTEAKILFDSYYTNRYNFYKLPSDWSRKNRIKEKGMTDD